MSEATPTRDPAADAAEAAAEAAQAEAEGSESVTIEWRDLTPFEIPRYRRDWPFLAVVAAQREEWPSMLAELLSPRTLGEIGSAGLTENDIVGDLMPTIFQKLGIANSGE